MTTERIRVCVRCRPFSDKEVASKFSKIIQMDGSNASLTITNPKNPEDLKMFTFDSVFTEQADQATVYDTAARPIVDAVLNGYNGTVFVYGQTGTGKTFSMQGVPESLTLRGIIPNTFHHIFTHIARTQERQYLVRVSYLEIYNEEVRDLLAPHRTQPFSASTTNMTLHLPTKAFGHGLEIKEHPEHGIYVKDLTSVEVKSVKEMQSWMDIGNQHRSVGTTLMNEQSSRSHAIFTIKIESSGTMGTPSSPTDPSMAKAGMQPGKKELETQQHIWAGQLHLVDLAGSERQSKTEAQGTRLKEATKINLSLSALGNCISALVDGKSQHIPYRDSKLTRLLQDSLGGNSKTVMIATLSPASYNYEETLSTLRYANRAKQIKNQPKLNEDPKDALLRAYQEEIQRLQEQIRLKNESLTLGLETSSITSLAHPPNNDSTTTHPKPTEAVMKKSTPTPAPPHTPIHQSSSTSLHSSTSFSVHTSNLSLDSTQLQQLQKEIEEERKKMLESKELAKEEKEALLKTLEDRLAQLEEEKQQKEELEQQLKNVEAKLLMGGINIIERVNQQEQTLEQQRLQKMQEEQKQRELKQKLEQKQEENTCMEEEYVSLQEEVDIKTRKIQKLWAKLEMEKREMEDLNEEWRLERMDLISTLRELTKESELKQMILDYFVPPESLKRIQTQLKYDEEEEEWIWIQNTHTYLPLELNMEGEKTDKQEEIEKKDDGEEEEKELDKTKEKDLRSSKKKEDPVDRISLGLNSNPKTFSPCSPASSFTSLYPQYRRPICKMAREILNKEKIARFCIENILDVPLLSPEIPTQQTMQSIYSKLRLPPSLIRPESKAKKEGKP